jgi:RimJ/RimL family protein N-acetyltransferase
VPSPDSCAATSTPVDRIIVDGPRIQQWLHEQSGLPLKGDFHGVARELDGEIVSAFGYDNFTDGGCALHVSTLRPLTRTLVRWAFRIPFEQWGMRFLMGCVSAKNLKSLNLATKLGFEEAGNIPGEVVFFALKKEQCRWIHEQRRRISPEGTRP